MHLGEDKGRVHPWGGGPPEEFGPLPWAWEVNANATKLLGFPTASSISTELMEVQVHNKITASISKLFQRQLSLAGRIVAANSLILSTIWYLLSLWAGDLAFLSKL